MKIRMKGNSLRLRLTKSEVKALSQVKSYVEETYFTLDNKLTYALQIDSSCTHLQAKLAEHSIVVSLPEKIAKLWTESDQVSLSGNQKIDESNTLKILVEKDFACLQERADEDDSDAYDNPNLNC